MSIEFIVPMNVGNGRTPMSSVLYRELRGLPDRERGHVVRRCLAVEGPDDPHGFGGGVGEEGGVLGDAVGDGDLGAVAALAVAPVVEAAAQLVADDLALGEVGAEVAAVGGEDGGGTVLAAEAHDPAVEEVGAEDLAGADLGRECHRVPAGREPAGTELAQ